MQQKKFFLVVIGLKYNVEILIFVLFIFFKKNMIIMTVIQKSKGWGGWTLATPIGLLSRYDTNRIS